MAVGRLDPFLGKHGRGTYATAITVPRRERGHAEEDGPSTVLGGCTPAQVCFWWWVAQGWFGGAGGSKPAPRASPKCRGLGG